MSILRKTTLVILILSIANLNLPNWVFAQQKTLPGNDRITMNQPGILTTPERDIPLVKPKKKFNKWVWIGLGALAAGAIAAAASGGSDDGGDGGGGAIPAGTDENTGNITIQW